MWGWGGSTFCSASLAWLVGAGLAGPGAQGDLQGPVRAPARQWGPEQVPQENRLRIMNTGEGVGPEGKHAREAACCQNAIR